MTQVEAPSLTTFKKKDLYVTRDYLDLKRDMGRDPRLILVKIERNQSGIFRDLFHYFAP